ncbi:MAG TPA: PspA/IM30 family protein [Firmicutes bacterium]|jgi:phage shock protein A|nr:PspA/IM30 family protein [Bacillota bacterium]
MGILSRMSTVFKAKMSRIISRLENPNETLDYSYEKQLELLRNVKRGLTDVVASKKRLELQAIRLQESVTKLEEQARTALTQDREDLARLALERKAVTLQQLESLKQQIADLQKEQDKLAATEQRLQTKVDAFRTRKEVIKAQYSAAEAQVKIGEAATGLSEELADVDLAIERAQDKTEQMKARAAAIDELVEAGNLTDSLSIEPKDDIARELNKLTAQQAVEADLERLKKEVGGQ